MRLRDGIIFNLETLIIRTRQMNVVDEPVNKVLRKMFEAMFIDHFCFKYCLFFKTLPLLTP